MNLTRVTKMAGAVVLMISAQAWGAAINITTSDFNGPGGSINTGSAYGWNGGPAGVGGEDNEVEQFLGSDGTGPLGGGGIVRDQIWDLEAIAVNGNNLFLVGGYDFQGQASIYGSDAAQATPGDLFIKIGGTEPGYTPLTESAVDNSAYGWNYAVRFTPASGGGLTASVFALSGTTPLNTVINDQLGSNPWKVNDPPSASYTPTVSYHTLKTAGEVSDIVEGDASGSLFDGLLRNSGQAAGAHYVVAVDMAWLAALTSNQDIYLSYTMQCGNDHIKASLAGGFRVVPDGGLTLILLGLSMAGLSLLRGRQGSAASN